MTSTVFAIDENFTAEDAGMTSTILATAENINTEDAGLFTIPVFQSSVACAHTSYIVFIQQGTHQMFAGNNCSFKSGCYCTICGTEFNLQTSTSTYAPCPLTTTVYNHLVHIGKY